MYDAADQMEFERAAILRDRIEKMRESIGQSVKAVEASLMNAGPKKGRRGRKGVKKAKVPRPKKGV